MTFIPPAGHCKLCGIALNTPCARDTCPIPIHGVCSNIESQICDYCTERWPSATPITPEDDES